MPLSHYFFLGIKIVDVHSVDVWSFREGVQTIAIWVDAYLTVVGEMFA